MAETADLARLAKYPFLSEARQYVAETGFTLADLLDDAAHGRSRARAADRLWQSLDAGEVDDANLGSTTAAEVELFSYPLARALVAQVADNYLNNRFAVAESKLVRKRLKDEESPLVKEVAAGLGLAFEDPTAGDSFVRIHFLDYLRHAPTRQSEWKLVNQTLDRGFVSLTRHNAVRLVEEALRNRLVEELGDVAKPGKAVERAFSPALNRVRMKLAELAARRERYEVSEVVLEVFPPCMTQIWESIKAHVNVPHMGRFAIVAFLHKLGMNSEQILEFFQAVPDFDASKSRYQIEHITGQIGGSTEYTPPSCQTMATYGICPLDDRDELCFKINHPLTYYRRAYWKRRRRGGDGKDGKKAETKRPESGQKATAEARTDG